MDEKNLDFSTEVSYVLDKSSIQRIDRLVSRYRKEFDEKTKENQKGGNAAGPFATKMQLTPKLLDGEINKPLSAEVVANLEDPANMVAMISGETTGVTAIRRFQALLKIYNDHVGRKIPLPSGVTTNFLVQKMRMMLEKYGTEMRRNISNVEKMDRSTAVSVISNLINRNSRLGREANESNTNNIRDDLMDLRLSARTDATDIMGEMAYNSKNTQELLKAILLSEKGSDLKPTALDSDIDINPSFLAGATPPHFSTPLSKSASQPNMTGKGAGKTFVKQKRRQKVLFKRRWVPITF